MKQHKTSSTVSGTTRNQFRTPRRVSPQSSFKTSKSTTSKRTASPGLSIYGRSKKRASLPSSHCAQSTLTQIDFVTQSPCPDDDELDYIDNTGGGEDTRKAAQPVHVDDDLSEDTEYRPPPRPVLPALGTNNDHPKRRRKSAVTPRAPLRKSQTPGLSNGRGKRKSTDKPPAKPDKTLTQMDFVRRYITIDDDDDDDNDVNMGYIQAAPQQDLKEDGHQSDLPETKNVELEPPLASSKRNRMALEAEVNLSTGKPISQSEETQSLHKPFDPRDPSKSEILITPRKPRRLEIPSSQSPESPGLAIITSSQFRSATRSPQKMARANVVNHDSSIKEESLGALEGLADKRDEIQNQTPTQSRTIDRNPPDPELPLPKRNALSSRTSPTEVSQQPPPIDDEPPPERAQRERTVIYETDAETDNDDLEDDIGAELDTPTRPRGPRLGNSNEVHGRPQSPIDDSQDLPLPSARTCADPDSTSVSEAPMSDASMFYRRVQPATQFPHEPIPTLNTQKLSELFPNEGSTQYPRQGITHNSPQCLLSSQTQTQSQRTDQVEIVPESSPARDEISIDHDENVFQRPQPPGPVVQVESSQPVNRGRRGSGKLLSRSQLLTSSVMESIPMPNFWIGSQESVGEPYSLPEQ